MPHADTIRRLNVDRILIGDRARQDLGDLQALAESIAKHGLLQPIGVTDAGTLVFGERRLRACSEILGRTTIEARVVDVPSIVAGEYAENEMRKDFTPSERIAIAEAVKAELGSRQGQRTDIQHPDRRPDVRGETRDIAAKRAGFGSGKQLDRAASVVAKGVPELVDKMDAGKVSISAAAQVARLPEQQQREIAAAEDDELKAKLRELAEAQKRHNEKMAALPTKAEALERSKETGGWVRANDGEHYIYVPPGQKEQYDVWLYMSPRVHDLAEPKYTAEQFANTADDWNLPRFPAVIDTAVAYLTEVKRIMEERYGAAKIAAE